MGIRVRDSDSLVLPALFFRIAKAGDKDFSSMTDMNGRFEIAVSPGDYQLTSSEIPAFKAFLKISELGPIPQTVDFTVDSAGLCVGRGPAILKSIVPKFPPAAQAVRASGLVIVAINIGSDGKVLSAKAISGHPLLRRAAEVASQQFLFESSTENAERTASLSFLFLIDDSEKKEIPRFSCPYRILVVGAPATINTMDTR
ncbi:MAG: energy transducer TonB [Pyrinomonadaceae bacterium]